MKLTEQEIDFITEFLRMGEPLPKEFKEKVIFQGKNGAPDEKAHIKHPLIHEYLKGLVGTELKRQGLFDKIRMIALSDISVLIEGERGTGKKLVAKTIHEIGPQANGPFIMVDCNSISDELSESLLSGHERGAFPGAIKEKKGLIEMAGQGTIVFNEIEKLPTKGQAIVLRFLQNNTIERLGSNKLIPVDARLIATSHSELKTAVKEGIFRNDLYFHISSVKLSIPPLRERRGDIQALGNFFLLKYAIKRHKKITGFTPAALEALWCHELARECDRVGKSYKRSRSHS
jgi:DNA-binding NtrC family response regulator